MSFDWSDYLKLAETLVNDKTLPFSEEAASRCAISRAYYAAFCLSRDFINTNKEMKLPGGPSDHQLVAGHFKSTGSSNSNRYNIGKWLVRLRDSRNSADYEAVVGDPAKLAQTSVILAQQLIEELKKL